MVEPEVVVASAFVMLMVLKGTREVVPESSTIHSAFALHNAEVDVNDFVTVLPAVTFSMITWPPVVLDALTVTVMTLPADTDKPDKS